MDQIISVIRRCLPLCFPLPESDDQNEAYQVVGVEAQSEDGTVFTALRDEHEACKVLAGFDPESYFRECRYAEEEAAEAAKAAWAAKEAAEAADHAAWAARKAAEEANRKAWVEVIRARCEVASLNDGCRWHFTKLQGGLREHKNYKAAPDTPVPSQLHDGCQRSLNGVLDPFVRWQSYCKSAPDCPVMKEVKRSLRDPTILLTIYRGTHNHPLPVGGITAMASTALSDGICSVTQAYRPYHACYLINPSSHPPNIRSIHPDYPSKGIVVDLTSNSDDPPQFPVRDEDQNQAPKILVGEDSKKDVQSNSTTTSTSFFRTHYNYDVFLSFRGEDTRKNFTDHLYYALKRVRISTFRDNEELRRGKTISTELLSAIRGSKIFIVVFSKGYASSRWCLDELVEIVHRKNIMGHTLLPIFYYVDPSDVRKQTGTFAKAFAMHEKQFQSERVQRWKDALTKAANCSGWDLEGVANGYESSFIEKIVAQVSYEVEPNGLRVARHQVGINYRVSLVKDLLNLGTSDVLIVGIYGMGGIGKTTLAKGVYNQICTGFEGSSFLNIKETSKEPKYLVRLQEQLLSEILKAENLKINNVDRGINLIEKRIHGKRVLIVLDDVDDLKQLHALVEKQWFGPGSRIIVTTRDEHLLNLLGADKKYEVSELNYWESLKLFSWHAFMMAEPKGDFLELSNDAVDYAQGLPLAIEVLGCFLKGKSIDEWKDELQKLRRTPDDKIQKILKTSLDSLDEYVMDIFLDIACFFVGMDKEYIIKILDGCDFFPVVGIKILTQRSLLTIDDKNKLRMHDLIQGMGREIVHEKSPKFPGERSRLWFREEVLNVLLDHTGTKTVEGLILKVSEDVRLIKTEAFTNMNSLRLLQINDVHLIGSYERLSKKLRWLCWHGCPLKFLPHNFHLKNLVILDMQRSNFKQVWEKIKILNKLKVLNLSNSEHLTKSPVFSQVPQLEKLILEGCVSLVEIHESIGCLKKLVLLNLKGCRSLRNLPSSISNLKFLKTLDLSGCLKVDKLPEQIGRMMALTELLLDRTAIKQLPPSFGLLEKLESLSLSGCSEQSSNSWLSLLLSRLSAKSLNPESLLPASVSGLTSLKKLSLIKCNMSEDVFPANFGSLPSLEFLDLSKNNFRNLPNSIGCLPKLYSLYLKRCTALQSISGLFKSVEILDTRDCISMETLSISPCRKNGLFVDFRNCYKLTEIQGFENWESASIHNLAYDSRSHLQCRSTMGDDESCFICLTGSEVPNFFSHQTIGCSISFRVPSISKGQFLRFLVCAVYANGYEDGTRKYWFSGRSCCTVVSILNKTRGNWFDLWPTMPLKSRKHSFLCPKRDKHLFLFLTPRLRTKYCLEDGRIFNELVMESGDEIEVEIQFRGAGYGKKCGVHVLIFDEPNVM